jgi:hypothetical protein
MTTAVAPSFEETLVEIATVFGRADLAAQITGDENITQHVAVTAERGVYRCVPAASGLHVWWVPLDGDPVQIAVPQTPARAAGVILDHREGVPA